jgi:hypothetical protein
MVCFMAAFGVGVKSRGGKGGFPSVSKLIDFFGDMGGSGVTGLWWYMFWC